MVPYSTWYFFSLVLFSVHPTIDKPKRTLRINFIYVEQNHLYSSGCDEPHHRKHSEKYMTTRGHITILDWNDYYKANIVSILRNT